MIIPTWGYELLSPGAILISALGAWWFARASINNARDIAIKKSTFDYLSKLSWDEDYLKAKNIFLEMKMGPKKLRAVSEEYERLKNQGEAVTSGNGSDAAQKTIDEHSAIKNILNEYEALAIAIKSGALEEDMIRDNIQQQFVNHIDSCKEFIEHTRANGGFVKPKKIWCEVQLLADKWRD